MAITSKILGKVWLLIGKWRGVGRGRMGAGRIEKRETLKWVETDSCVACDYPHYFLVTWTQAPWRPHEDSGKPVTIGLNTFPSLQLKEGSHLLHIPGEIWDSRAGFLNSGSSLESFEKYANPYPKGHDITSGKESEHGHFFKAPQRFQYTARSLRAISSGVFICHSLSHGTLLWQLIYHWCAAKEYYLSLPITRVSNSLTSIGAEGMHTHSNE